MIFVTLGTYPIQFNRLLKYMDDICQEGIIDEEVFGQIGHSTYEPKFFSYVRMLDKEDFDKTLESSSAIIGHAGMGTISLAIQKKKPLLVLPRLKKYGEHVNDHQLDTAIKFEELGHILASYNYDDLKSKMLNIHSFTPKERLNSANLVANRIQKFFDTL